MLDLHIHTVFSDGVDTVEEILKKAETKKLEVISITDHNTCSFYEQLKLLDMKDFYKGQIVTGCEFTTSCDGRMIEILGYGFDTEKMNFYLEHQYDSTYWKNRNILLGNRLVQIFFKKKVVFNLENCLLYKDGYTYYGISKLFEEAKKNSQNDFILPPSMNEFSRSFLYNPDSDFYLGYDQFFPSLLEIVTKIHEYGGLAFLAHPYAYQHDSIKEFLEKVTPFLDGIECFYPHLTKEQLSFLITFAKQKELFISGGTDYHGDKIRNDLGISNFCSDLFRLWQPYLNYDIMNER